jgi:2-methylisocitrate lyase-like PEP mutase family enzyme
MKTKTQRMRALINDQKICVSPGVYDGYSIRLVEQMGYATASTSGAGLFNARFGKSESLGVMSLLENVDACRALAAAVDIPLMADADTGYGNAITVYQTTQYFEAAGVVGINIEDQTFPKRCGHLDGKGVVPVQEMHGKIRAALDARRSNDTLILARTDALAVEGLEAALDRAEKYLECGVDALFVEALRTPEQMKVACDRFAHRIPLLANMVEGGKTPILSAAELGKVGFKIVIFPGGTARAVSHTLQAYYGSLKTHQTTAPWRDNMLDFDQLNELIETPQLLALGKKYEGNT